MKGNMSYQLQETLSKTIRLAPKQTDEGMAKKIQKQTKAHTKMYYVTNVAFLSQCRKDKSCKDNQLIIQKNNYLDPNFIPISE